MQAMASSCAAALVTSSSDSTYCHLLRWFLLFSILGVSGTVSTDEGQLAQSTLYAESLAAPLLACPVAKQPERWEGEQEPKRSNGTNFARRQEESTREPGWIKSHICQVTPGGHQQQQLFCAYTQPSFQDGFGISIVTTPETLERILALDLPVLRRRGASENLGDEPAKPPAQAREPKSSKYYYNSDNNNSDNNNSNNNNHTTTKSPGLAAAAGYETVPVPGKGLGMRATRPLGANEVYMSRTPSVMVDDAAVQGLGVARLTSLLVAAVEALPSAHRDDFLSLTTHEAVETRGQRVHAIFDKNNFLTEWEGVGTFHSTFTHVSRLNHACRPNSAYVFDSATLSHKVFAARDIATGEELTLTYQDPFQTYAHRQFSLHHHWGFECTCSLCTASAAEIEQSDARITRIQNLWSILDQYAAPGTSISERTASPEDAELLIQLYREEGLHTRLVEAYYRTAVEYNGRGKAKQAVHYAERAIEAGQMMESGIRPFLDNMRALARDPRGHWTWMFRVPK